MSPRRESPSELLGRHAPKLKRLVPESVRPRAFELFYRTLPSSGRAAIFARRCRSAARYCERNGSALYAHLLRVVADDIEAHGPCWDVVQGYGAARGVPPAANTRALMAAVHRIVLEQPGTALEPLYPSTGGTVDLDKAGPAFLSVVADHRARVRELMDRPVQTNEVTRSRALVGGFLLAAEQTGRPLRVLELGASGGLNLRWDHYRYEVDGLAWGDPHSPVRLLDGFTEGRPPLHLTAEVAERRGCDLEPLDATSREGQLTLLSQVWPDQTERIELLRGAFAVAERVPAPIDRADVLSWATEQLATPRSGVCTVVFDTGVKEYLKPEVVDELEETIARAGRAATEDSPVARLHVKPAHGVDGVDGELELAVWPGERRETLALHADPYARQVRWVGPGG
jgi:hypothetical protein